MTDTAQCSTFSTRGNAKRAAAKMIKNGTAPAVDCGIKPREDGRFEIKWKTNPAATTEEAEAELTAATETVAADSEPLTDPTLTQAEIDAAPVDTGEPRVLATSPKSQRPRGIQR
jgi:hypothetical protein